MDVARVDALARRVFCAPRLSRLRAVVACALGLPDDERAVG
jgi:hypothetical protein